MATLLRPPVYAFIFRFYFGRRPYSMFEWHKIRRNGCVPDLLFTREETANDAFIHDFVRSYSFKKPH